MHTWFGRSTFPLIEARSAVRACSASLDLHFITLLSRNILCNIPRRYCRVYCATEFIFCDWYFERKERNCKNRKENGIYKHFCTFRRSLIIPRCTQMSRYLALMSRLIDASVIGLLRLPERRRSKIEESRTVHSTRRNPARRRSRLWNAHVNHSNWSPMETSSSGQSTGALTQCT